MTEQLSTHVRAYLLHGMWDLPGSGIKLMFPTLAEDSLPQKSPHWIFFSSTRDEFAIDFISTITIAAFCCLFLKEYSQKYNRNLIIYM